MTSISDPPACHQLPMASERRSSRRRILLALGALVLLLIVGGVALNFYWLLLRLQAEEAIREATGTSRRLQLQWVGLRVGEEELCPILEKLIRVREPHKLDLFDGAGPKSLRLVGQMHWLEDLEMQGEAITDDAITTLQKMERLERLHLHHSTITDRGLGHIGSFKALQNLLVDSEHVTDNGLAILKGLPHLEWLVIRRAQVTDQGVLQLAEVKTLRFLTVQGTKVTEEGLRKLNELRPDLKTGWSATYPVPPPIGLGEPQGPI